MLRVLFFITLIILLGIFIRFYNIDHIFPYGWDQSRDAFTVKDIIEGKLILEGPKTGVGHFHLGPLWFYLLVPFFFITNLDPIASQYLNILICSATFYVLFYVTKRLFSTTFAFISVSMYALSSYLIEINRVPWNVSLMPILAILIFYFIYKLFQVKKFIWSALLMSACGIAFHAHFSAIIFPPMIIFLWLLSRDKRKILLLLLKGLPFYIIWFIPTIIFYLMTNYADYQRMEEFLKFYFVGFHLKFALYRFPDIFIQFRVLLSLPLIAVYVLLLSNSILYFKASESHKLYIKIIFAWLTPFIAIFSVYGGQISGYYFLFTLPLVYYSFFLAVQWMFSKISYKIIPIALLVIFTSNYVYQNIKNYPIGHYGLAEQKERVKKKIQEKNKIHYEEGDIEAYLYSIMINQKLKRN